MRNVIKSVCALSYRNIEKRLGQSNGPQGALTCLTLKDVVITSDLGPVTISVTIYSSRLQQPLTCRLQCCIIAGKPSAIVTELHATDLVNHSLCDGLQLSLSFVDDKGGQVLQAVYPAWSKSQLNVGCVPKPSLASYMTMCPRLPLVRGYNAQQRHCFDTCMGVLAAH